MCLSKTYNARESVETYKDVVKDRHAVETGLLPADCSAVELTGAVSWKRRIWARKHLRHFEYLVQAQPPATQEARTTGSLHSTLQKKFGIFH